MNTPATRWAAHRRTYWLMPWLVGVGFATAALGDAPPVSETFGGMDLSVRPGNDFYDYANGTWLKDATIPDDRASFGIDEQLGELTDQRVADLIRGVAATSPAAGSIEQQIADSYRSVLDEAGIEAKGLAPVQPQLKQIEAIKDRSMLAHYLGTTLRTDVDVLNSTQLHTERLFGLWVAQDLEDPGRYAPFLLQGGLGMPDRDYYLLDTPPMREVQDQYRHYIAALLKQLGVPAADVPARVTQIYELEHRMAQAHVSRGDSEDVQRGHTHWSQTDFPAKAPGLDWKAFFAGAGLPAQASIVAWQPTALAGLSSLVASVPLPTWKAYLRVHALDHFGALLPKAVADPHFAFHDRALSGTPQRPERWKTAVTRTNTELGLAVGQLYVQHYFSQAAKAQVEQLVQHLLAAFATHIDALDWMSPQTKVEAKAKLATLKVSVGYPDHWQDYRGLKIEAGDAFGNAERAERFDYQRNLAKLSSKTIDRGEWVMTPQEVNAVNLPAMNALNFPAAILQPPFFDPTAPAAANYGAIGATIGHEISHSFDDQGAQFDAAGKLRDWWQPEDYAHFKAASRQLVKQFDTYRPFPDLAVNGAQTLSENLADLAGLAVAYSAFTASLGGAPAPARNGFSADQQFFISYGISWRGKQRDASLRRSVLSNGHAPRRYRALTVRNLDAWYAAFNVQPGETLYLAPADRIHVW